MKVTSNLNKSVVSKIGLRKTVSIPLLSNTLYKSMFFIVVAGVVMSGSGNVMADTSDKRIALSNNYAGNSWRQAMLESWERAAEEAVGEGTVAAADAFTTSENQSTEQAAQIQNMILQGYDAIVVNAASPTALNGAIKMACDAGIIVVSFDGIVTEPCAWRIAVDFRQIGRDQIQYLESRYPEGGNLLEIRGLAGVFVDDEISAGIHEAVADTKFEIAGSVYGDWAQDVAQRAVAGILPSLPEITGVVTQGGDGYGAAQAFQASNRPIPTIIMGNRQDELQWWAEHNAANGYETISLSIAPGVSSLAFWVTQQILDGQDVAKDMTVPFLRIDSENLDQVLNETPEGSVANQEYTLDDAQSLISSMN